MNGGRQIGEKLSRSASVARQLNFVFTKITRPLLSTATSWHIDVAGRVAHASGI